MPQVPALAASGLDRLFLQLPQSHTSTENGLPDTHNDDADEIAPLIAMFRKMREEKEKLEETQASEENGMKQGETVRANEVSDLTELEDRLYRYVDDKFLALQTHIDARLSTIEALLRNLTTDCSKQHEE